MDKKDRMGSFISELRKEQGLTQKQLAEKLAVTDKAVSKWERGLSYPDIEMLEPIANVFGITTTELLNGEKHMEQVGDSETVVQNTLRYARKITEHFKERAMKFVQIILTATFLIGIFTTGLVDFILNDTFTWSIISCSAIVFTWLVVMPILHFRNKKGVLYALISLTIFLLPFLFVLQANPIVKAAATIEDWFWSTGVPVSIVSLVALWIAWFVWTYTRLNKWFYMAITCAIAAFVDLGTSVILSYSLNKPLFRNFGSTIDFFSGFAIVFLAVFFFFMGTVNKSKAS